MSKTNQMLKVKCHETNVAFLPNKNAADGKLDGVPYTFWEECFSTKNVEVLLKPFNFHPIETKTISDKFAAVGILQGYLDVVNRHTIAEQSL
nr:putative pre-16S rRNA nuclease [Tanacetum cinerariifolium]